jgi:hypothetical protein
MKWLSLRKVKKTVINGKEYTRKELKQVRRNFKKNPVFDEATKKIFLERLEKKIKDNAK